MSSVEQLINKKLKNNGFGHKSKRVLHKSKVKMLAERNFFSKALAATRWNLIRSSIATLGSF